MISIIVPAFNSEKTIGKCIESILAQEFEEEFELIVVDDGSTDNTAVTVKQFKEARLLQQKNSGPAIARNNGARNARGEIIVFIDSDCETTQDWLREMVSPFKDASVAAVQGAYKTRQKSLIARFEQTDIEYRYEKMKQAKQLDWIGSYSAAVRKNIFLELNGFDESFPVASGEDTELSFRIAETGMKIVFNPKAIVFHSHPESLQQYLRTKFYRAYWRVLLYKKHAKKAIIDSYTPQLLKLQIPVAVLVFVSMFFGWKAFALAAIVFLATAIPFFLFAAKKDMAAALASFGIAFLRAIVFAAGLLAGTIRAVLK